jgi:preprotein translocase subunit SecD
MKPLDLQVGIQNSYEAARSEAVRLERPQAQATRALDDAQREQQVRDQSVTAPEANHLQDDLFKEDEYTSPDYTAADEGGGKKQKRREPKPDSAVSPPPEEEEKPGESEAQGGFSTFA